MREHIVKDTYAFRHAKTMTENSHIVILKGRQGTGKTTLAMHLASIYMEKNYKLAILSRGDRVTLADIQGSSEKFVVILDNCSKPIEEWFDYSDPNTDTTEHKSDILNIHNFQNDFKIIVTATHFDTHRLEKLRLNGIMTGNNTVNLNEESPEHIEDNQSIMRCLLTKYHRELSDDAIKEAAETSTYYGFPRQCVLFCEESRNFELGSKYFRQPPVVLMDITNELKNSKLQEDRIMYSILVYIILNPETGLPSNDLDMTNINSIFKEIYKTSKTISEKDVKNVCRELYSKQVLDVLCYKNNVYLLHPVVCQAVMVSYADVCLDKIIKKCDLMKILDIVRPLTHDALEGEVVLIIDRKIADSVEDVLAQRIALACLDDAADIPRIVQSILACKFVNVLHKAIDYLQTKLKTLITDKRIKNVMVLMKNMTLNGSLELLDYTPTTFVLTWTLIALRESGQNDSIQTLVDRYIKRGDSKTAVEILRTVVDQHNNSFLHYCVLWWHNKDNPFIRYLCDEFRHKFDGWVKYTDKNFEVINNRQMSAVELAAYFGNHELLDTFIKFIIKAEMTKKSPAGKMANVIKEVDKLLQCTENGKTNNTISSYSSCPFLNMTVCGPININDTFDYEKACDALTSFKGI